MTRELINNMNETGGGLAVNITGKYESNRHAIAKIEKVTFGEAVKELKKKKNGGFNITAKKLLEVYTELFGTPEWHHAGFLPKQYGGGMKKTYFLNEVPTADQLKGWLEAYEMKMNEKAVEKKNEEKREEARAKFLKKYATPFTREEEEPNFSITMQREMKGKYGWFEADYKYSLQVFYSGYTFKSSRSLEKYFSI